MEKKLIGMKRYYIINRINMLLRLFQDDPSVHEFIEARPDYEEMNISDLTQFEHDLTEHIKKINESRTENDEDLVPNKDMVIRALFANLSVDQLNLTSSSLRNLVGRVGDYSIRSALNTILNPVYDAIQNKKESYLTLIDQARTEGYDLQRLHKAHLGEISRMLIQKVEQYETRTTDSGDSTSESVELPENEVV